MFTTYLKLAWRNMQRSKINSFINIAGLATGMSCVILIAMYVQDELNYDRFFKDAGRIFQVNMKGTDNGVQMLTGNTAPAVGPALVSYFPEIATYTRIYRPGDVMVRYEQNENTGTSFTEKRMMAVDSNFLQLFNYPLLQGNWQTCLQKPNAVVITEQTAKKYFPQEAALSQPAVHDYSGLIGKPLLFGTEKKSFEVTAILKDIPASSSFQFDMLVPVAAYAEVKKRSWNWFWLQVNTYVKLRDNTATSKAAIAGLEAKFPVMVKEHAFQRQAGSYEAFIKKGNKLSYELMPFTDVHLYAYGKGVNARLNSLGNITYVYIFTVIALFIIVLACVNFMNLSTAQSVKRAKEVGIRKVLGSLKASLIKQFLTEAMLYSFIAMLIALVAVLLLLKPFNIITGKSILFSAIFSGNIWLYIVGLCFVTGLLAGIYPAFYLTSFNPVHVLKGFRLPGRYGNLFIRNGLVVFQFSISIALIICTLIVFKQLQYIQNKDLGLDKEHVVVIANTDRLKNTEETFRRDLLQQPGVVNAAISSSIPTRVNFADSYMPEQTETDKPLLKEIELSSFMVDNDFIPTYQMKIIQGRNFAPDSPDSASVILNETAAKLIGWKEATGKYMEYPGNNQRFKVIGVVKDFNVASLRSLVEPFALFHTSSGTYNLGHSFISVRLRAGNTENYLSAAENKWKAFVPAAPFDYSFLDSEFESLYRSEQRMGAVFGIFSFLSVFVACLGLFGLSVYTVERRTKEIGIRKVLGASVKTVVALLSADFLKLVLLSGIIAFPAAWLIMGKWLQDFAYRVTIGWAVFVIAVLAALLIAAITISFQAIRAAIANPVKSLRTE